MEDPDPHTINADPQHFINQLKNEQKRNLTRRERKIKQLSTAYLYLYTKMQEEGLLSPGDEDNFFKPEILH